MKKFETLAAELLALGGDADKVYDRMKAAEEEVNMMEFGLFLDLPKPTFGGGLAVTCMLEEIFAKYTNE